MSKDGIVDRVRALLAKANDAGATEAEAAAAASLAERLLARHALEMRDVLGQDIVRRDTSIRYLDPWTRNLAVHAARLYGCEPLVTHVPYTRPGRGKNSGRVEHDSYRSIAVFGRPASAEVAVSMIDWLVHMVYLMSREYSSQRRDQLPFQRGAGERLATRLWEMREAQSGSMVRSSGSTDGTSLILIEQSEAAEWVKKNAAVSKVRMTSSDTSGHAALDGWNAGGGIHLGGQVEGRAGRALEAR
jgi:hypothetical protein